MCFDTGTKVAKRPPAPNALCSSKSLRSEPREWGYLPLPGIKSGEKWVSIHSSVPTRYLVFPKLLISVSCCWRKVKVSFRARMKETQAGGHRNEKITLQTRMFFSPISSEIEVKGIFECQGNSRCLLCQWLLRSLGPVIPSSRIGASYYRT